MTPTRTREIVRAAGFRVTREQPIAGVTDGTVSEEWGLRPAGLAWTSGRT